MGRGRTGVEEKDASLLVFEAKQVLDRVDKMGDLFEPVRTLKQNVAKLLASRKGSRSLSELGWKCCPGGARPRKITKQRSKTVRPRATPKKKRRKV